MAGNVVQATFAPTPEQLAAAFWALGGDTQQAEFFAALDRIAGVRLCFQMASVVDVIRQRAEQGDHAAMNGFQTMLAHAQEYADGAASYRAADARREIGRMAAEARA